MAEREMIKRTPLKRSTKPIRSRSKKTEKIYVKRRKFVAEFLEKHPWCQRCYEAFPETQSFVNRSTEVHEVISRARGGDILEEDNCRALCHECHMWIHAHPRQATLDGWLKSGKRKIGALC